MINEDIIEFLKIYLFDASLESFGIKKQFLELEFSNERFVEIMFFLDCECIVTSSNEIVNKLANSAKDLNSDTFDIVYFINANRKRIVNCDFISEGDFKIDFENNYSIIFELNSSEDPSMSITFKENDDSKEYTVIDIKPKGDLQKEAVKVI